MGCIIRRPDGIFYYQWIENGKIRRKSLKTRNIETAKMHVSMFGPIITKNKEDIVYTIPCLLDKFLEAKKAILKPNSIKIYDFYIKNLKSILNIAVNSLKNSDISDYIKRRKELKASGKTIHEELFVLRSTLKYAWSNDIITELPIREWPKIKTIPSKPDTIGFYSTSDIEKLKLYFKGKAFEPVFLFAIYTGCRRSEIASVRTKDVDLKNMVLRIRNIKTETSSENESRYISINKYLKPVLKKLLKNNKGELLFPEFSQWKGSQAAKILFQACKETGIQYKRFHGIRHTVATHLLASGISLRDVMHVMGWKEIKTAQKYIHLVNASARHLNKLPY